MMAELTDEAKKLVQDECATVLEKYKDALREVEGYKWAARAFFTLVLGGSLLGFFQLQNYLDERVAKGTSHLERLLVARSLTDGNQPKDALPELIEFAHSVSSKPPPESIRPTGDGNLFGDFAKAGPTIRTTFFLNLLDVLSTVPGNNLDDATFGQVEWEQMLRNTVFQTQFLDNPKWSNDPRVLNRLGNGFVKFASDRDEALRAKSYIERELQFAIRNDDKAAACFFIAIFSLAQNNIHAAVVHMLKANEFIPTWVKNPDDFFATTDPILMRALFPSLDEFKDRYKAAFLEMTRLAVSGEAH
jgi:hypothetical protein